ncbi:MAG: hypothetical protein P8Z37_10500 [Acidobacteriota bacterium]
MLGLFSTPHGEGQVAPHAYETISQWPPGPDEPLALEFMSVLTGPSQSPDPGLQKEKGENRTDSSYQLRKLKQWRDAALSHNPGKADSAAIEIGSWMET